MIHRYRLIVVVSLIISRNIFSSCDPKQYSQSNQSQLEHTKKELSKLNLSGKEKILDIGSGDGLLSTYIAQELIPKGQLIGIDNSAEMVTFAQDHNANANIAYLCEDACDYLVEQGYEVVVDL